MGGGGGGEARLRHCSEGAKPPPSPSSLTPSELPEPTAPADKGTASPDPEQHPPPAAILSRVPRASRHHAPHSAPSLAGRRSAGTSGAAGPGAGSRAPPCSSVWRGGLGGRAGSGFGGGIGGLPLGAAEHTATREGGHREIRKRGPERVRHDPAVATWWQVRQERRRRERVRGAEAEAAAGRGGRGWGGEGREGPCGCRLPGGGAAGHQCARPRPRPPCTPNLAGEGASSLTHLSPRLTCCFSWAGANPSGRQRSEKIEVSLGQQPQPASLLSPLEAQKLDGTSPSSASSLTPLAMR